MAINSFQRDLNDPNQVRGGRHAGGGLCAATHDCTRSLPSQLIRGLALRVLCGIRVREIVQIQIMSVKKCASDSSAYVRKTSAHSVGKIYQIDPETKPELVEIVDRLLGDKTTAVLSSAVAAFNEVCPEQLALLHPHYRKLCHLLADLDEWGQIMALNLLSRYVRTFFANPEPEDVVRWEAATAMPRWMMAPHSRSHARARALPQAKALAERKRKAAEEREAAKAAKAARKARGKKGKKGKGFYSDEEESDDAGSSSEEDDDAGDEFTPKLQEDHALVLRVALPLLRSRNSGVVLAVAALHHYCGPRDRAVFGRIGRALVRIMRGHREVQYIVLTNIVELAKQSPDMFRKYLKDFFIAVRGPPSHVVPAIRSRSPLRVRARTNRFGSPHCHRRSRSPPSSAA